MKVKFWGTRGSIPSPGSGTIKYGGNTPCVEIRSDAGELLIIDCGSGMRDLGNSLLALKKPVRGTILLSHTHWDHIQGFPFFKPAFIPGNEFTLYGPQDTSLRIQKVLEGQMEHRYFPVTLGMMGSSISFLELTEERFTTRDFTIDVLYMNHTSLTLGFRITGNGSSVCYCTDTEPHALLMEPCEGGIGQDFIHRGDKRFVDFVRGADLLIIDTQYSPEEYVVKKGWGHSSVDYVSYVALLGNVRRLCLFHHDPEHSDAVIDGFVDYCARKIREFGASIEVIGAQESQELHIQQGART